MSATVTVGCKLPHGIYLENIDPKVFDGVDKKEGVQARPSGQRVRIHGNARPVGVEIPEDAPQIVSGYAITPGVPADFWDTWLSQNKDAPFVKAGLIFAHAKADSTIAMARDGKKIRSGFEGLDPSKPAPGITKAEV